MQTRKRAKSVSFGKKSKENGEKEHVKKTVENEELSLAAKKVSEKAESTESKESNGETQSELSATPPKVEEPTEDSSVVTPASEFVSDNPLASSPELPKDDKEHEVTADAGQGISSSTEVSQPVETAVQLPNVSEPQTEAAPPEL